MIFEELGHIEEAELEAQSRFERRIHVCAAAGCLASGADAVKEALSGELQSTGLEERCQMVGVGCMGLCSRGPLVSIQPDNVLLAQVRAKDAKEVVGTLGKKPPKRLACPSDLPFFKRQLKVVLENMGRIDPERIEEYIAVGGYSALHKGLTEMTSQEVIDEVVKSGLRGRGGAGYPTGLKWSQLSKESSPIKYVVCNADEGDPGAFMDRSVLEGDPHRVLEGMILAGYATGATQGFIYVRAEYPLAIKRLNLAIKQASRLGLLGHNICGTPVSFGVEVRVGAGAFVCGEETALMASIEGGRGTPRPRPPFPTQSGIWGRPTMINNVETFANIPPIIRNGGKWLAEIGTEKSKGTKVFSLSGKVVNTGLIEVPMGITLREIIFEIGGGIPFGGKFKAVQTGGPSGGCVPDSGLDVPVDYESLSHLGTIMGSGGMVVMDDSASMVDVARFFLDFSRHESCGKCIPCRVGTVQMHGLLDKIAANRATSEDLAMLEELCDLVRKTSLCGLGQTAPTPVVSTLRHFREEYLSHLSGKA
ncbi:MAG: hypothetical protein GHCLOJNM_02523 [bacterium]|nr:hypothetical protein [bacterium]